MNMKKTYINPQLSVAFFDAQDIVTASVADAYDENRIGGVSINDIFNQ